jgi:hypothetical protein
MPWPTSDLLALLLAVAVAVFAGVVLPAVWSAQPARRQDAATVLAQLLAVLHRGHGPACDSRGTETLGMGPHPPRDAERGDAGDQNRG